MYMNNNSFLLENIDYDKLLIYWNLLLYIVEVKRIKLYWIRIDCIVILN